MATRLLEHCATGWRERRGRAVEQVLQRSEQQGDRRAEIPRDAGGQLRLRVLQIAQLCVPSRPLRLVPCHSLRLVCRRTARALGGRLVVVNHWVRWHRRDAVRASSNILGGHKETEGSATVCRGVM